MKKTTKILNKSDLIAHYDECIENGHLDQDIKRYYQCHQRFPSQVILQTSSGVESNPLHIPRLRQDVEDIAHRVLRHYVNYYHHKPKRIALFGGMSHIQAANKLPLAEIDLRYFSLRNLDFLNTFKPDLLCCYPSILRQIIDNKNIIFDELKAIKFGGEPLFFADIKKIYARFNKMLVIEQYGSTEMPAVLFRIFTEPTWPGAFEFESQRFESLTDLVPGWQSIIVKDQFQPQAFAISEFYDTGDMAWVEQGKIRAIKRKDEDHHYREIIEKFIDAGCTQVQINSTLNVIYYNGPTDIDKEIYQIDTTLAKKRKILKRILPSSKLPVIVT